MRVEATTTSLFTALRQLLEEGCDARFLGTLDGVILPQVAWYSAPTHQEHYKWLRKTMEERRLAR